MIDVRNSQGKFPWSPYSVTHDLVGHPAFELESIVKLSQKLDPSKCEYQVGDLNIDQDPKKIPTNGLNIQETIESIENNESWMVLRNVEDDPEYGRLLTELVDAALEQSDCSEIGRCEGYQGFIIVSSPNAVTPFHVDPEHNFLLQLRGRKTMYQWRPDDESIISKRDMEKTYFGEEVHRNLPYKEAFQASAHATTLEPGDGLYVPLNAPHWVKNGSDVSISFSITFQSHYSNERNKLFSLNAKLRAAGCTSKSVDEDKFRDRLIATAGYRGVDAYIKLFGKKAIHN